MKIYKIDLIISILLTFVGATMGQSINEVKPIAKINGKIEIDGKVDEAEWLTIDPLPLTMHWPSFKSEITEPTDIRVAYDDEYIYISAICYDSEPSKIQTPTFRRDDWNEKTEQITILLDTYDDNENILAFSVSATGSRVDAAIKNDAQGDEPVNTSWNSYWIANSTLDDQGWQTEMRIPFSSLRFQEENGKVKMGIIAYRYIARKHEMNIYPAVPPDWGFWSFVKASQAQTVSFENIQNKRPWYTSPYVLAGIGHHHEENNIGDYEKINDQDFQVGLDVQHAFSDNFNADFTINTDFAQVEADNQVVNLSRFSLFFPEKRKFFLERASIFDFKNDFNNNMFYSRNIGINDGKLIPMWGGVRLVARMDKWDVGLLNMQSQETGIFASENFGVLRLRKNVINQRSYVGGMMTSRVGTDGHRNFAYGVDGIINMFKQDYLQINLAQSRDTEDTTGINTIDRSRIYVMWEKRIINGFGYKFSYSNVGNYYNPQLGFERRKNFSQLGDNIFYSWFAPEEASLRQTTITLNGGVSFNNTTNDLETSIVGLTSNWIWDRGSNLTINIENFDDNVPEAFNLSDSITISPAYYSNKSGAINYNTAPVGLANVGAGMRIGTFYHGNLISASIFPQVIFSKYFQLSAYYEYITIHFPELKETFESHVARINITTALNVKLSTSAFVQFNSLQNISALNFRLRFNPVDGNDLYIVYNETLNNDPTSEIPNLPTSDSRAIIIKYIHTFR